MLEIREDRDREQGPAVLHRRKLLLAGMGFAAAPLLTRVAAGTADAQDAPVGNNPFPVQAWGATTATSSLGPMKIERRAIGPNDVLLDVLYCGICHSDIHTVRDEWRATLPIVYPSVPGHEIIGRVQEVGSAVTKFRVGDIGGVGCMVDSCRTCENCLADREQNCLAGATFTYNSPDAALGGQTFGGYSDKMVVKEHFVIRIPPGMDLPAMAPLLCAGITPFSPMQHWNLATGQRVGVVGRTRRSGAHGGKARRGTKVGGHRVHDFAKQDCRREAAGGPRGGAMGRYRGNKEARQPLRSADLHGPQKPTRCNRS